MSKIQFDWAKPGRSSVFLGLTGPSGSGKTLSALRIAEGLRAPTGTIFMIDTEGRRGLHYAADFKFRHGELTAPFTYGRYLEAIEATGAKQGDVVIVDSVSHAHEGVGGLLDQHEAELNRMAGDDWKKRERVKFAAWIKPKAEFTRFLNRLIQMNIDVIFCFRSKEKMAMLDKDGKNAPHSIGWQPIATEGLAYEMTAMLVLPPGAEGVPDLSAEARKMPSYVRKLFTAQQLTEETGRKLRQWADQGDIKRPPERKPEAQPDPLPQELDEEGMTPVEPLIDDSSLSAPVESDIDPKIAYANEAVELIHSNSGEFLKWWNGLDQDTKYANLTPASLQRFAVELSKYTDKETINGWVQSMTDEEKATLAPVRETVRGYLAKGRK